MRLLSFRLTPVVISSISKPESHASTVANLIGDLRLLLFVLTMVDPSCAIQYTEALRILPLAHALETLEHIESIGDEIFQNLIINLGRLPEEYIQSVFQTNIRDLRNLREIRTILNDTDI